MNASVLPTQHVAAVEAPAELAWLVETLWLGEGVGLVAGSPKSCKSWLALELALSVASGTPALGTYAVPGAGPVLIFAAEDSPPMVKARLEGMAAQRGLRLEDVPLHLIRTEVLRLDRDADKERLQNTVRQHRPKLLVLDPFVRLHRIDENSALEVSGVLAYLRELQRRFGVAILVVHHARKAGGGREGMTLRGSGDFWAWSDTNLYLRRKDTRIRLVIEHRSAAAPDPIDIELVTDGDVHLRIASGVGAQQDVPEPPALRERIVAHLEQARAPSTQESIRAALRVRTERLVDTMRHLESEGALTRDRSGWRLADPQAATDEPPSRASTDTGRNGGRGRSASTKG